MATTTLWQGYAESWEPDYTVDQPVCTMKAKDGFKVLGNYQAAGPSGSVGAGEATGTRIGRLADLAQWSASDRALDVGNAVVQATTLAQNVLQEMQAVELTELGHLYMSEDGKLTFDDRHTYAESSRSNTVQQTFSDDPNVAGMPFSPAVPIFDDSLVKNIVNASSQGQTTQTATNATSVAKYLSRVLSATGLLLTTDLELSNWANWLLFLLGNPENRFDTIEITPFPDVFPTITVEAGFNINPASPYLYFDDPSRGQFNRGQFAPTGGVWTDISSYALDIHTMRGKSHLLDPYQEGSATIKFRMDDGQIDPNNLGGTYVTGGVTNLQPETPIRVRATYAGADARMLAALGVKFHDRVRVVKKAWVSGQASVDQQGFVEAIEHSIHPGKDWTTKFGQVSATLFGTGLFIFDSATLGVFNQNVFAGW